MRDHLSRRVGAKFVMIGGLALSLFVASPLVAAAGSWAIPVPLLGLAASVLILARRVHAATAFALAGALSLVGAFVFLGGRNSAEFFVMVGIGFVLLALIALWCGSDGVPPRTH